MSHRHTGSDAVHVIPTNDPPPENRFPNPGDSSVWATETDYSRVWAVNTDDTESPSKKIRGSLSSEIGKSFFKTKLCCKFRSGTCPYDASSCHFAHSVEELRRPPSNRQETAAETREEFKIPAESGRSYKGRHCKKFYSGEGCPYGESCTFLHDEASKNRESLAISLGPRGYGATDDGSNVAQILKPPNWKTRICNKWEITGYCPFGTNCHFAHGASELHNFGGGLVEGEGKIGMSTTQDTKQTGQADTVSSLVSPGVPSQRTSSAVTQKPNGVRTQRKWKGPDKISRVYGDWIDDIE
uniref:Zinc finger CCCH domain-containing protein 12 n=1 Tax=Noccaea caerulescens TaxID=107243 RepID=A0A1J3GD84_NOCCA